MQGGRDVGRGLGAHPQPKRAIPWKTSIQSPSMVRAPAASASRRSRVRSGRYTMSITVSRSCSTHPGGSGESPGASRPTEVACSTTVRPWQHGPERLGGQRQGLPVERGGELESPGSGDGWRSTAARRRPRAQPPRRRGPRLPRPGGAPRSRAASNRAARAPPSRPPRRCCGPPAGHRERGRGSSRLRSRVARGSARSARTSASCLWGMVTDSPSQRPARASSSTEASAPAGTRTGS